MKSKGETKSEMVHEVYRQQKTLEGFCTQKKYTHKHDCWRKDASPGARRVRK